MVEFNSEGFVPGVFSVGSFYSTNSISLLDIGLFRLPFSWDNLYLSRNFFYFVYVLKCIGIKFIIPPSYSFSFYVDPSGFVFFLINLARDFKFLKEVASGLIDFFTFLLSILLVLLRSSVIFFHLLTLCFICSSFFIFFRWKLRSLIWNHFFFHRGFSVINFPVNSAVAAT